MGVNANFPHSKISVQLNVLFSFGIQIITLFHSVYMMLSIFVSSFLLLQLNIIFYPKDNPETLAASSLCARGPVPLFRRTIAQKRSAWLGMTASAPTSLSMMEMATSGPVKICQLSTRRRRECRPPFHWATAFIRQKRCTFLNYASGSSTHGFECSTRS